MNAQGPANVSKHAPTATSWAYAEQFHHETEHLTVAREAARELGLPTPGQGAVALLSVLAKAVDAKAVVEVGSNSGVSGLAFFDGMNAAGVLTSVDPEAEHQAAARKTFLRADLPTRRFRLITGQPLDVLPKLADNAYDIAFINGDKLEYPEYVAQSLRLLRHGGLVIVNHVLLDNKVADPTNEDDEAIIIRETLAHIQENEELLASLIPAGDGLLVAVKR